MQKPLISVFVSVLLLAIGADTSRAQVYDHLKCYKAKDQAKFSAGVTLQAFQDQFNVDPDCKVAGRGKLFCVPVDKTVTAFSDNTNPPLTQSGFVGQDLEDDRICYRIKCPKEPIQPETVTDQFGTRKMGKFKVSMLCTPAFKGTPPTTMPPTTTTTVTTTTLPMMCDVQADGTCGGPCPNPVQLCLPLAGTTICDCQDPPMGCGLQADGTCSGACPVPTDVCTTFTNGCDCVPPQACDVTSPNMCADGTCPPGQACVLDPAVAQCVCN